MRSVVCIARADGAGGEEIGKLVAERLGFLYVDAEIVARAATRGGLDPGVVADAERRRSLIRRVLDAFAETGDSGWGGLAPGAALEDPSEDEVRLLIREAIAETMARGRVVIGGHAASHTLEPTAACLRIFVTASATTRVAWIADDEQTDLARAERLIKDSDAGRADYLKRFYGVGQELPIHYDLVINTEALSIEEATALVVEAAADRPSSETSAVTAQAG
jgi:cytidylate kinase